MFTPGFLYKISHIVLSRWFSVVTHTTGEIHTLIHTAQQQTSSVLGKVFFWHFYHWLILANVYHFLFAFTDIVHFEMYHKGITRQLIQGCTCRSGGFGLKQMWLYQRDGNRTLLWQQFFENCWWLQFFTETQKQLKQPMCGYNCIKHNHVRGQRTTVAQLLFF